MRRFPVLVSVACVVAFSLQALSGAPAAPAPSPAEQDAVERFLSQLERPPVAYRAWRRLEASSSRLKESAWMEAFTYFDPSEGFQYSIVDQGGSTRIADRVLRKVLENERENAELEKWRKGSLSHANYRFDFGGHAGSGMLRMTLTPRRRDSRLVAGSALLKEVSGDLVRVEGRLAKSPSFWVRWVDVASSYAPVAGAMMPVAIESTADVRIAGMSTFLMTYRYQMVDGQAVTTTPRVPAAR
jgi:hypothetical protein